MIWRKCSESFSDASQSSDIKEQIIKLINMLKPFNMEPCKAIFKAFIKLFEAAQRNCENKNLT